MSSPPNWIDLPDKYKLKSFLLSKKGINRKYSMKQSVLPKFQRRVKIDNNTQCILVLYPLNT